MVRSLAVWLRRDSLSVELVSRCRESEGTDRIVLTELLLEIFVRFTKGVSVLFSAFIAFAETVERVLDGAWVGGDFEWTLVKFGFLGSGERNIRLRLIWWRRRRVVELSD